MAGAPVTRPARQAPRRSSHAPSLLVSTAGTSWTSQLAHTIAVPFRGRTSSFSLMNSVSPPRSVSSRYTSSVADLALACAAS